MRSAGSVVFRLKPDQTPARDENLALLRQVGAGRFDEQDSRQMILTRDVGEPRVLPQAGLTGSAALGRRFIRDDQALPSADQGGSADDARAGKLVLHPVPCERRDFEKIRALV